jgi:hypothetical protein
MKERTLLAIKLISSHLLLIILLIFVSFLSEGYPFFTLAITQTLLLILFIAGYWEFFGLRFRRIFCAVAESIILGIFAWKLYSGSPTESNPYIVFILSLIEFSLAFELVRTIRVIYEKASPAFEIEFPFRRGNYLITDGGNSKLSRLMNYHYYSATHKRNKTNNSMLYATDIVKIVNNKSNFLPVENDAYLIFNEPIYSPMEGEVVKVVNGIPDNQPYSGNYPYNTGNTVVIKKDNLYLLLGHLKNDSILVKEGDLVRANDRIGTAGNSGWTERPHLHMQLIKSDSDNYWYGNGVCIRYRNQNLYKNRLIGV